MARSPEALITTSERSFRITRPTTASQDDDHTLGVPDRPMDGRRTSTSRGDRARMEVGKHLARTDSTCSAMDRRQGQDQEAVLSVLCTHIAALLPRRTNR